MEHGSSWLSDLIPFAVIVAMLVPLSSRRGSMIVWPARSWLTSLGILVAIVGVGTLYGVAGLPGGVLAGILVAYVVAMLIGRIVGTP